MKNHVIAILLFLCTCFLVACNVEPTIEETNDSEKCQDTLRVQLDNFINSHKFDTICINEQWINSVKKISFVTEFDLSEDSSKKDVR